MMKRNHIYKTVLGLAIAALTLTACSDEWDDHYNSLTTGQHEGSLWEAIQADPNLSNFASVVRACGYDKSLGSSQTFTVFAPTNSCLSAEQAQELINAYNAEKGKVNDDDNTTVKEFLQNHMTLYNHSVSSLSNDTIVLMNGKYAFLTPDAIDGNRFLTANQHYGNGVLYTLDNQVKFFSNLFEYMRKDNDLDSVRSFFYNGMFYRKEFIASESVPGGIVDGKTVYLDSVFIQQNDLFGYNFLDARINSEDSTYLMIVPTNKEWKKMVDEYSDYFVYDKNVPYRDSLAYTNTRMAIMKGTVFSRTFNGDAALQDSAMSTNCTMNYNYRRSMWGADSLHYYEYYKPFAPDGALAGATPIECSNGTMLKSDNWKIDKQQTFHQLRIIEAEQMRSLKEVSTVKNNAGDDEPTVAAIIRQVPNLFPDAPDSLQNNPFYNVVSNNRFVEFEPQRTTVNPWVTFNITDVLANVGYDIYLITAPATAHDWNATDIQKLPTLLRCTLSHHDIDGNVVEEEVCDRKETVADEVNALLLAENFKFPVASFGLNEDEPQVTLKLETRVTSAQLRSNKYTRTMRIDCILLKPHEDKSMSND